MAKKKPAKAPARPVLALKFGDGTVSKVPLADVALTVQDQAARMVASDSPGLRQAGRELQAKLSAEIADGVALKIGAAQRRSSGGQEGAKVRRAKAAKWHAECEAAAKEWLAVHRSPSGLTSAMVKRFGRDRTTVARVLRKAGVI